jgi:hypothetical protein
LNGSVRQKKKTESGKLKAEIGKRQFVSFVSWLFKTRAHPQAVSRLRRATAVQGSAWGGCRPGRGHAPQSQRTPPHGLRHGPHGLCILPLECIPSPQARYMPKLEWK